MRKPKFDKNKCLKCKYHGMGIGYSVIGNNGKKVRVYCNYTNEDRGSCLRPISDSKVYDIRGNDYNNCLLFKEGEMEEQEDDYN